MAVAWAITDNDAKNIYTKMCNWYNSPNNLPNKLKDTGVFFGYANFTRDKLYYCIEFLKNNYGRGWFTSDGDERREVLRDLANELYTIFGGSVDSNGIFKFLNWVYNFAAHDTAAVNYFQGGYYSLLQSMKDTAKNKIVEPLNEVVDDVKYAVNYPSFTMSNPLIKYSLSNPWIKWGLIFGGGILIYKTLKR